jgi:ATP-dependent Clp protease adaptor protein ClpS
MANGADPPGGGGGDSWTRRESGVAEKSRTRVKRPPRFKVVLFNDDYTPMEFVVSLLESVFGKSPAESNQLMLRIHRSGSGIAGVYVLEVAETRVATVHRLAEERGYPLRAAVEEA